MRLRRRASNGCRWAFTSDARSLYLLDTQQAGTLITKIVHKRVLGESFRRKDLDEPAVLSRMSEAWVTALQDLAPIITGRQVPIGMPADELFVEALRELMAAPVAAIRDSNPRTTICTGFRGATDRWMVDEQGWTHDPDKWEAEVSRAAKLTAYVFVTRILFYEALRRSKTQLNILAFPPSPQQQRPARSPVHGAAVR